MTRNQMGLHKGSSRNTKGWLIISDPVPWGITGSLTGSEFMEMLKQGTFTPNTIVEQNGVRYIITGEVDQRQRKEKI